MLLSLQPLKNSTNKEEDDIAAKYVTRGVVLNDFVSLSPIYNVSSKVLKKNCLDHDVDLLFMKQMAYLFNVSK
jgi:hypothetical protein